MHVGRKRLTAEGSKRGRERISKAKFSVVTEPHHLPDRRRRHFDRCSSRIRHVSAKTTVR